MKKPFPHFRLPTAYCLLPLLFSQIKKDGFYNLPNSENKIVVRFSSE